MSVIVGRQAVSSKIFKSIMAVVAAAVIASLVIITGVLYSYFSTTQQAQLKGELNLAASATEQLGTEYLEELSFDQYRITWVDSDGKVVFDSHADENKMENHADREEIKEAFKYGTGSSIRRSSTLTEQTIYEAVRLNDGSVLRISVSRTTAVALVFGMLQPILIVMVIAIALSAWLSHRMAMRVVEPLNKLNLDKPLENDVYEELSPLLHRIHAQHQEIEGQMRTLKSKQDEFDQIIGNMNEALVLLDTSDKIVSINPAAIELFEASEDCTGKDFLTIDRKSDMHRALEEAKQNGHFYFRGSIKGREYQFDVSRIDSDGNIHGVVILAFDITEQVNAEQARREFTANVSHELKTPLQTIIGSAELLENDIVKQEDVPRFVERIRKEASRLVVLIDDIIRLSQLDEGSEMPKEQIALLPLAQEVCESLCDIAQAKDVTLTADGDDVSVIGVRRLLHEIIYNLCDNAIKYNNPGGKVAVSIKEQQEQVKIIIADNGIGIAPQHREKVFERFYRVDKSHSKQSGGTGLGLSIVKHAVQYHNGKIDLESEQGKGTTITVTLNKK